MAVDDAERKIIDDILADDKTVVDDDAKFRLHGLGRKQLGQCAFADRREYFVAEAFGDCEDGEALLVVLRLRLRDDCFDVAVRAQQLERFGGYRTAPEEDDGWP